MAETKPTEQIRCAVNDLLQRNDYTFGTVVSDLYLGPGVLVARLRRPVVIEGQWEDLDDRTADLFDLMDDHRRESGRE